MMSFVYVIVLGMARQYKYASAVVLGMHDALVSLTGMIGGLTFALANRRLIILSAIIASVAAGLSMGASCYLAERTNENPHAFRAGVTTGVSYLGTCALLILPYFLLTHTYSALFLSFVIAVLIIFSCNFCIGRAHGRGFIKHALEMLIICASVSVVSFMIGELAKHLLGIAI